MERMLRPQGLFQSHQPKPFDWQQPYSSAAPGAYPPAGQYPPGSQYPATAFQQADSAQGWPSAPTGGMPQAGAAALPPSPNAPADPNLPTDPNMQANAGQPGAGGYPPDGQFNPGVPQGGTYPVPYAAGQFGADPYGNGQYGADQYGNGQYGTAQYGAGQYGNGQYGAGQYGNGQYGQGQFPTGQFPTGQFPPAGQYGPDGQPLGADAGGPGFRAPGKLPFKLPKGKMVPVALAAAVAVIVVTALVLATQGGSTPKASSSSAAGATPGTTSSAASAMTQQQSATALSGLLAQSGTDHSDVNAAVTNVEGCKGLAADARTFNKASANRRTLLSKLAQLPGRSALPAGMLSDLTGAWQASATVDADLAKWAADGIGHCKKNNLKDPNYTATIPFDSKATNGKTTFVAQWNSLARKYGLSTYQPSQI